MEISHYENNEQCIWKINHKAGSLRIAMVTECLFYVP